MKFKIDKPVIIKLAIILAIFLIAPFAVPFSIEFVLMADIMGLEALILLLLFQSKHLVTLLLAKVHAWKNHIGASILLLLGLYMMQPDIFLLHAIASTVLLMLTCSLVLAIAIWLPSVYLSKNSESQSYIKIKLVKNAASCTHH